MAGGAIDVDRATAIERDDPRGWDRLRQRRHLWTRLRERYDARLHRADLEPDDGNVDHYGERGSASPLHSAAVLLPDGRVFTSGGQSEETAEYFSPPYLFKGTRPTITTAPDTIAHGQQFFVATPEATSITKVHLIRLSSVTHAFNQDQRINRLQFSQGTGGLNVTAPASGNVSPPGYYMLFVVNSTGVPSVAKISTRRTSRTGAGRTCRTCCNPLERSGVAGLVECQRCQWLQSVPVDDIRFVQLHVAAGHCALSELSRLGSDEWYDVLLHGPRDERNGQSQFK